MRYEEKLIYRKVSSTFLWLKFKVSGEEFDGRVVKLRGTWKEKTFMFFLMISQDWNKINIWSNNNLTSAASSCIVYYNACKIVSWDSNRFRSFFGRAFNYKFIGIIATTCPAPISFKFISYLPWLKDSNVIILLLSQDVTCHNCLSHKTRNSPLSAFSFCMLSVEQEKYQFHYSNLWYDPTQRWTHVYCFKCKRSQSNNVWFTLETKLKVWIFQEN